MEQAEVKDGIFLQFELHNLLEPLNDCVPRSGAVRSALVRYISEEPISDFVYGELVDRALRGKFQEGSSFPLIALETFADTKALADELVEQLDALPRKYTITLPLPEEMMGVLEEGESSFALAGNAHLRSHRYLNGEYEASAVFTLEQLALSGKPRTWPVGRPFLQFEFEGFVARYSRAASHTDALDAILALLGSMVAHGLLSHKPYGEPKRFRCETPVHQEGEHPRRIKQGDALSSDLEKLVCELEVRGGADAAGWRGKMRADLQAIGKMISAGNASLMLGCKWLFSSYSGDDQLLKYVKAAVVLETLLGDQAESNKVGLGVLLGNRCAYLIAKTTQERQRLLAEFREIYDIRSRIVHRGKSRLSRSEIVLFYRLLSLGHRVIRRETELLG